MPARTLLIPTLMMWAAIAASAVAQDVEAKPEANKKNAVAIAPRKAEPLEVQIDGLIADLASPQFPKRQQAARKLTELEASAVPVLEARLMVAEEPVATPLRQVVARLRKRLFDVRIAALKNLKDAAELNDMPDWDRFVAVAGSAEAAMPIYKEMLLAEQALFAARMFAAPDLSSVLENRSRELREACDGDLTKQYPIASAAALMLIASDETVTLRRATSTNISESLQDTRFGTILHDGFHSTTLKSLTSVWLKRTGIAVDRPLLLAMEHKLPVGREIALRTLERTTFNQSSVYSLLCLGVLQETDSLPVVESVIFNQAATRPFWPAPGKSPDEFNQDRELESTYTVQVRDVALAVAIHLRGKRPQEFGMEAVSSEIHLFSYDSMGFNNDEDRNDAIRKYRAAYP